MEKKGDPIVTFDSLDTQRLKEAFFSPKSPAMPAPKPTIPLRQVKHQPKQQKNHKTQKYQKKSFPVKFVLIGAAGLAVIALVWTGIALFRSRYDVVLINRTKSSLDKNALSLLHNPEIARTTILDKNTAPVIVNASAKPLLLQSNNAWTAKIDFVKPFNAKTDSLLIYLRSKSDLSLRVVAKDARFHSNALKPLIVAVQGTVNSDFAKIVLPFQQLKGGNVNLAQITQITIDIQPDNKTPVVSDAALLKDIVLIRQP